VTYGLRIWLALALIFVPAIQAYLNCGTLDASRTSSVCRLEPVSACSLRSGGARTQTSSPAIHPTPMPMKHGRPRGICSISVRPSGCLPWRSLPINSLTVLLARTTRFIFWGSERRRRAPARFLWNLGAPLTRPSPFVMSSAAWVPFQPLLPSVSGSSYLSVRALLVGRGSRTFDLPNPGGSHVASKVVRVGSLHGGPRSHPCRGRWWQHDMLRHASALYGSALVDGSRLLRLSGGKERPR